MSFSFVFRACVVPCGPNLDRSSTSSFFRLCARVARRARGGGLVAGLLQPKRRGARRFFQESWEYGGLEGADGAVRWHEGPGAILVL